MKALASLKKIFEYSIAYSNLFTCQIDLIVKYSNNIYHWAYSKKVNTADQHYFLACWVSKLFKFDEMSITGTSKLKLIITFLTAYILGTLRFKKDNDQVIKSLAIIEWFCNGKAMDGLSRKI